MAIFKLANLRKLARKSRLSLSEKLQLAEITQDDFDWFCENFCSDIRGYSIKIHTGASWGTWQYTRFWLKRFLIADHLLQCLRVGKRNGRPVKWKIVARPVSSSLGHFVTVDIDDHSKKRKWMHSLTPDVEQKVRKIQRRLKGTLVFKSSNSGSAHLLVKIANPERIESASKVIEEIVNDAGFSPEFYPPSPNRLRLPFGAESAILDSKLQVVESSPKFGIPLLRAFNFIAYTLKELKRLQKKFAPKKPATPKKPVKLMKLPPSTLKANAPSRSLKSAGQSTLELEISNALSQNRLARNSSFNRDVVSLVSQTMAKGKTNETLKKLVWLAAHPLQLSQNQTIKLISDWIDRRTYNPARSYIADLKNKLSYLVPKEFQNLRQQGNHFRNGALTSRQFQSILEYVKRKPGSHRFKLARFLFQVIVYYNMNNTDIVSISQSTFQKIPGCSGTGYLRHKNCLVDDEVLFEEVGPPTTRARRYRLSRQFRAKLGKKTLRTFESAFSQVTRSEKRRLFGKHYAYGAIPKSSILYGKRKLVQ